MAVDYDGKIFYVDGCKAIAGVAAKEIGISRSTLRVRITRYNAGEIDKDRLLSPPNGGHVKTPCGYPTYTEIFKGCILCVFENRSSTYGGKAYSAGALAKIVGVSARTMRSRIERAAAGNKVKLTAPANDKEADPVATPEDYVSPWNSVRLTAASINKKFGELNANK